MRSLPNESPCPSVCGKRSKSSEQRPSQGAAVWPGAPTLSTSPKAAGAMSQDGRWGEETCWLSLASPGNRAAGHRYTGCILRNCLEVMEAEKFRGLRWDNGRPREPWRGSRPRRGRPLSRVPRAHGWLFVLLGLQLTGWRPDCPQAADPSVNPTWKHLTDTPTITFDQKVRDQSS